MKFYLFFFIAMFFTIGVWGQTTVELNPIADASIAESNPDTNYGTNINLVIGKYPGSDKWLSLIKFDLSSIPAGATIVSAELRLEKALQDDNVSGYIGRISSSWSENTVTLNNGPSGTMTIPFNYTGQSIFTIDVTSLVEDWIDGTNTNYGFLITPVTVSNDNYWTIKSRETSSSNDEPRLTIEYNYTDPNSTAPTSLIASPSTICSGESTTLTVQGGSLGAGASWFYYDGGCGVNGFASGGDGYNPTVSPTTTTTYYVRAVGTYNTTSCASVTVYVNNEPSQPGTITGNSTFCLGDNESFSISSVSGATSYTWEYTGGGTPSGIGTSISFSPTSSGTLRVRANNSCGSSSWREKSITVNSEPSQPGTITGNSTVCSGDNESFSISSVSGATSYTWEYTGGGTPSGTGTSISFSPTTSGTLRVRANNSCGSSSWREKSITVNSEPSQPGTITGNSTVCSGDNESFSISSVSGATSYTWEYTGGGTPSGTGTSISFSPTTSGTLRVRANNSCGSSGWREKSITVNSEPNAPSTLTATDGTECNEVDLSWSSVLGATYKIMRGSTTLETDYSGTTYTDDSGAPTSNTEYKVYALNDCGQSSSYSSDYGYAKTTPDAPSSLTATDGTVCYVVELEWDAVTEADSYNIHRNGTSIESSYTGTSYTDNTAPTSTTQYKIYSKNECGTSTTYASDDGFAGDCTIIPFEENNQKIIIYPNPVSDRLFIESEIEVSSIFICNELGQIVITQDMNNTSEIGVSNIQPGVYVLNTYGNDSELVGKFKIIKK